MRLPLFNPTRAGYCSCPPKYNLNTYLGACEHGCLYCYARKFPSFNGPARPRLSLLSEIEGIVKRTKPRLPVVMSDCTDPYQPLERKYEVTRRCADVLVKNRFPLLIVTKSALVTRDADVLRKNLGVVALSVTSLEDDVMRVIEPNAPRAEDRIEALAHLSNIGVTCICRIDPIIPGVNDDPEEFDELVKRLSEVGVKQVTIATMKPVRGFFNRLARESSELHRNLKKIYERGEWKVGYKYLEASYRTRLVRRLRPIVLRHGLQFASCRESLSELNTAICDGSSHCRGLQWEVEGAL